MSPPLRIFGISLSLLCASSSSKNSERNIIVDRNPFVEEHFPYGPRAADKIVSAAQGFAVTNKMDFLLARKSLPKGDFNATAAGSDLNLKVMHVGAIDRGTATIFAVARSIPSDSDFKKAREFACAVGGACR